MKGKFLVLVLLILFVAMAAVSAEANDTALGQAQGSDVLEKSYFCDDDGEHEDDTVVTSDVVKYYGDKDTKFKVKVYDNNHKAQQGVYVSFGEDFENMKEKVTNSKGNVYFPINYKVGKHTVETYISAEEGTNYWYAMNTVKVKSTITPKEMVKFSTSKEKFKVKFLTSKGKVLANKNVKFTIDGKTYKVKTDAKGFAKIKKSFKVGKHKIVAYNPSSKEKRNLYAVILSKGTHKISLRIDNPTVYFPTKKLSNGDKISTVYESKLNRQYAPGVYVESYYKGLDEAKHTKLVKAKFFFKNKKTGKVITKTSTKVSYGCISIKPIKGYTPYKATVWYKDKK